MSVPQLVLFGRPGCHLCDEARELVLAVAREVTLELTERDITADDALHAAYLERIPVITIDGREALELEITERELRRALGADPRSRVTRA